ncbi:marine proteobacterial sortase target protein [Nitratireductor sp. ZSWI3]|uniref:marine proteobacterial sortase target protein n=1 Tax=Nitratireductor sp. ZSWI3 TaxID=2966359 RepID=UPI00214F7067|nr:marine proteobacterial sortase target protein [Nitratireductor sp. ZSWI3]MCR4264903.1 marine proteobacterial sortase target protein [Nitratireductor sp. ZSWI3]
MSSPISPATQIRRTGRRGFPRLRAALLLPMLAFALFLAQLGQARAQSAARVTVNEMQSGSLLLETNEAGRYVEAPRLATDVSIDVNGPTARAQITQAFENPTDGWVEALYVFPLPEESAVHSLKMIVGDRVIVADIKEKQAARAIYEQAKREGRKAALVEQQRPNVFTNSVANIGPHQKVVVQIEYQQAVRLADGRFSLRVPLVVAPRYNPADASPIVQTADLRDGWGRSSDNVTTSAAAAPIDTRLAAPGDGSVNPVTLTVELKAGFALGTVASLYHEVKIDRLGETERRVELDGEAGAERDFVLEWAASESATPDVGLFRQHVGRDDYVLAYVTPPAVVPTQNSSREIVFVIDNSGSMGGTSIVQAKASLDHALSRLRHGDRFNVIRFDNTMTKFFSDSVDATRDNVAAARRYVASLDASGGTEMLPPLHAALDDRRQTDGLRQIVFLTDGAISNEQQLLDVIAARRGRSRIFMVGIGSAPNTHLMNRAAELGRGTFTHIGAVEEVDARMRELFEKLENPAVTDLKATFSARNVSITPALLPDLYRGEPLVIAARMGEATGTVTIEGVIGNRPWKVELPLDKAVSAEGISKVWARRKIADAEVELTLGGISRDAADARILRLALEHHLVTRLTSLVAVDRTPTRPANVPLTRADIPLQLPAGWDYEKLFGIRAHRDAGIDEAAEAQEEAWDAVIRREKTQPALQATPAAPLPLPQTATPAMLHTLAGFCVMLLGLGLFLLTRGRERVG